MDPQLELIPGNESDIAHNLNRHKDISVNIQHLKREFIGKHRVC